MRIMNGFVCFLLATGHVAASAAVINYKVVNNDLNYQAVSFSGSITVGDLSTPVWGSGSVLPTLITGTVGGSELSFIPQMNWSDNQGKIHFLRDVTSPISGFLGYDNFRVGYLSKDGLNPGFFQSGITTWNDLASVGSFTYSGDYANFNVFKDNPLLVTDSFGSYSGSGTITFFVDEPVSVPEPVGVIGFIGAAAWGLKLRARRVRGGVLEVEKGF